jgi:hypothetical protein
MKRKRRSKNDPNGRMFKCECSKAYLSALALSNHIKAKHPSDNKNITEESFMKNWNLYGNFNKFNKTNFIHNDEFQRKRGRPKKKYDIMNEDPEINYHTFFQKESRKKKENETIDIKTILDEVFSEIYEKKKERRRINKDCPEHIYEKIDDHIFFNFIKKRGIVTPFTPYEKNNQILTSDEIFCKYFDEISPLTNKEFFIFILKFIVIFRDCINKYKNIELENSICILGESVPEHITEFTQYYDAEQIPELCNEFLTDYLSEEYYQLKSDHLTDFIEIIQHFCHWLYENNYSSSRLILNN